MTDTNTTAVNGVERYTKKPITIEAIRWTGANLLQVTAFTGGTPDIQGFRAGMAWEDYCDLVRRDGLKIFTLEGKMSADIGDWIIKGVQGECYPCKPDIFAATYSSAALAQEAEDTDTASLMKFYNVGTIAELIRAQNRHIERLQAKLAQAPSFAPQRVREG